jgi:hypothetical protein
MAEYLKDVEKQQFRDEPAALQRAQRHVDELGRGRCAWP